MGHYAAEMACPECVKTPCACAGSPPKPWKGWIIHGPDAQVVAVADYARQRAGDGRGLIELSLLGRTRYDTEAAAQAGRHAHLQGLIAEAQAHLEHLRRLLAEHQAPA